MTVTSLTAGRGGARMRARAQVATTVGLDRDGSRRSRVAALRSEGPLVLRPTIGTGSEPWVRGRAGAARVSLAAGAAGPIGGDRLELTVHVGRGSTLVLSEISHTLCLPGRDGAGSRTTISITVEDAATLIWQPEPIIAARRCDHLTDIEVALDLGARFLVREELLLGRHREPGGRLRQRMRVERAGRPLYHQDLQLGAQESRSPAVTGRFRAVGSMLVVDPDWTSETVPAACDLGETAALMPLSGEAVAVSALADDSLTLRRALGAGLAALGPAWQPG
ncbi:MAG TPA: urease accessory protein UreD [Segeticoccus sp.]|uniref:urease accessory protein UreD n=1 Tax=Segeticoccus sp. TaxID=2706531 RepID=UPI002D7FBE89|nr:urease accessory protein UreD [Segeticoccus sp.]HET8599112.1 urease accessory protein UreD [Segeticoccus sp.]